MIAYFINIDKKKRKKGFCAIYYFIIIEKKDEVQRSEVRSQKSEVKNRVKGLKSSVKGQRSGSGLALGLGLGLQGYPRRNLGSKWVTGEPFFRVRVRVRAPFPWTYRCSNCVHASMGVCVRDKLRLGYKYKRRINCDASVMCVGTCLGEFL